MNRKSAQAGSLLGHFSKSDVRYWQRSVFRQSYTRNRQRFLTKAWAMKVAHEGRRETFPLGTSNKAAAAARARDIYLFLAANGWEAALARYKKTKRIAGERNAERAVTVGEFLDAIFTVSTNHSTIEGYPTAFRKIVADLLGFSSDPKKFDYRSGGRDQWLAKVHSVELSKITPAKIQEWKQSFLGATGDTPLAFLCLEGFVFFFQFCIRFSDQVHYRVPHEQAALIPVTLGVAENFSLDSALEPAQYDAASLDHKSFQALDVPFHASPVVCYEAPRRARRSMLGCTILDYTYHLTRW